MPATNVPIVPYLVAIVYLSTFVRYSDFGFYLGFINDQTKHASAWCESSKICYFAGSRGCKYKGTELVVSSRRRSLVKYRKLPLIITGLLQLREGFWVGL